MRPEEKQTIALTRYSIIAPLVSGTYDSAAGLNQFYREAAGRQYTMPDGKVRTYSAETIKRWHRLYKKHGFDGLLPRDRSDEGESRILSSELKEQILYFKTTYPRITASEIFRRLHEDGSVYEGEVSLSTVARQVRRIKQDEQLTDRRDMRRYERPHINEVWCGDTSVGPYLWENGGKKRVYVIALIDDASRFITGAGLFLMTTLST